MVLCGSMIDDCRRITGELILPSMLPWLMLLVLLSLILEAVTAEAAMRKLACVCLSVCLSACLVQYLIGKSHSRSKTLYTQMLTFRQIVALFNNKNKKWFLKL